MFLTCAALKVIENKERNTCNAYTKDTFVSN